jgi:hypothetical protein
VDSVGRGGVGWIALAAAALLLGACSAMVDTEIDEPPLACSRNDVNECRCTDGSEGLQRCNSGGSFDPCKRRDGRVCDTSVIAGSGGRR